MPISSPASCVTAPPVVCFSSWGSPPPVWGLSVEWLTWLHWLALGCSKPATWASSALLCGRRFSEGLLAVLHDRPHACAHSNHPQHCRRIERYTTWAGVPGELLKCISPCVQCLRWSGNTCLFLYILNMCSQRHYRPCWAQALHTSNSPKLWPFPARSVLEEYKLSRTQRNLELDDSALHTLPCGNLTSLFFGSNNGQQKEGTEANHCIGIACKLGPEPGHSSITRLISELSITSAYQRYTSISLEGLIPYPLGKFRWARKCNRRNKLCPSWLCLFSSLCTQLPSPRVFFFFFFFFRTVSSSAGDCSVANANCRCVYWHSWYASENQIFTFSCLTKRFS